MPTPSTGRIMPRGYPFSWRRLHRVWSCMSWGFALSVVFFALRAGAALIDGHLVTRGTVTGFVFDPSVYTNFVFGWLLFTFYLWLPHGIHKVMSGLRDNEVLLDPLAFMNTPTVGDENEAEPRDWVEAVRGRFDRRRHFVLGLVAFVVVGLAMGFKYRAMAPGIWFTAGPAALIAAQVWVGVIVFCIISVLITCGVMIFCLQGIFRGGTNVRPLHPDGVGGLAPLANFALGLVYLISIVGIMLLAVTPYTRGLAEGTRLAYTISPDLVVAGVLYAALSPLVFFKVLATASGAMQDAKRDWLARIASRWDAEYPVSVEAIETTDEDPTPAVGRLKAIRELYQATSEFPVWPFDHASIRKFIGSYLAPIFTGAIIEFVVKTLQRGG